ncbi:hypothetical protein SmJEL517_g02648 [Synchytrium microbalum]|uniref:Protein arginine methyltransferase NDUFAF7 n=1 Tax=Synchytrium microbalum TaxID=1806994 RepID=A0A507C6R2_9FUNG|nr:uncharacterized protein SmJEL517_g02648 [Synchytrium microbalum]TPX34809.1 hypothetical protein SmJEL517_g02648 [Synchytrium microbalum]
MRGTFLIRACNGCAARRLILPRLINRQVLRHVSSNNTKEPISPLTKHLIDTIKISGPMSVAQYMRQALTHPSGGYYMRGDVFGTDGDFTTSPEISQMFGEIMAIWFITQYQSHNSPTSFQVIELGPGRGTLMADLIRTFTQFPSLRTSLKSVHLVEASPALRKHQAKILSLNSSKPTCDDNGTPVSMQRGDGVHVVWHDSLDEVPRDAWSMLVAHEFLDAMPIYKFELTQNGWREILVDLDDAPSSPYHFRFITAPTQTKASVTMLSHPQFQPAHNPYTTTKTTSTSTDAETKDEATYTYKLGDRVEIAPDGWGVARSISQFISGTDATSSPASEAAVKKYPGGVGLICDYGNDWTEGDSLRAIKKHKHVHVLSTPGECDLSANVDFSLVKSAVDELASAHGPISQATFLRLLGITTRLQKLLTVATSQEKRKELAQDYDRLVSKVGMGSVYKMLAVTPKGLAPPFPFIPMAEAKPVQTSEKSSEA